MKTTTFFSMALLLSFALIGTAGAALMEYGVNDEMFLETTSNRYFYDPQEFQGQTRSEVDTWLGNNPTWRYAKFDEVQHLLTNNLPTGNPAGTGWMTMGDPTSNSDYRASDGSMRYLINWGGWMDEIPQNPDQNYDWAVLTTGYNLPFAGEDGFYAAPMQGYTDGEYLIGGAWLVSDTDPLSAPIPAPLLLLFSGLLGLSAVQTKNRKKIVHNGGKKLYQNTE